MVTKNTIDKQPEEPHAKVNDEHPSDVLCAETFEAPVN